MPSPNNTNYVTVASLRSSVDNEIINDATVTLTVYDNFNTPISGEIWPVTLNYVLDSKGKYETLLSADLPWCVGASYVYEIIAVADNITMTTRCTKTATESSCGC
jgi:hypothetical protein